MIRYNRFPRIIVALPHVVDAAVKAGAERVEATAKDRVPVDTGDLQEAIHTEKVDDGWAVVAGDRDSFYGHFVEFGTSSRGARPFLIPALEEARDQVTGGVISVLRKL